MVNLYPIQIASLLFHILSRLVNNSQGPSKLELPIPICIIISLVHMWRFNKHGVSSNAAKKNVFLLKVLGLCDN